MKYEFPKDTMTINDLESMGFPRFELYSIAKNHPEEAGVFKRTSGKTASIYFHSEILSEYLEKHPIEAVNVVTQKEIGYRKVTSKSGAFSPHICKEFADPLRKYCEMINKNCTEYVQEAIARCLEIDRKNLWQNMPTDKLVDALFTTDEQTRAAIAEEIKKRSRTMEAGK